MFFSFVALTASSLVVSSDDTDILVSVYWYNRTDQYVYQSILNHTGPFQTRRHVRWNTPDRVISILGHRKKSSEC